MCFEKEVEVLSKGLRDKREASGFEQSVRNRKKYTKKNKKSKWEKNCVVDDGAPCFVFFFSEFGW